jgi:hypothetical protein
VADGGENGVGGIALGSLEIAAAKMAFGFHMAYHGLDGGAAAQLALDGAEHAALLPGDEDTVRVSRIVAAISLVDICALDLAPGEPLGSKKPGQVMPTTELSSSAYSAATAKVSPNVEVLSNGCKGPAA